MQHIKSNSNSIKKGQAMAFIADYKMLRTYDPVRKLELFNNGGGSDGRRGFKIIGISKECEYSAYAEYREPDATELARFPGAKETVTWLIHLHPILPGCNELETKEIITEAMMAYGVGHGAPAPSVIIVKI
jgi:hypothetical protein